MELFSTVVQRSSEGELGLKSGAAQTLLLLPVLPQRNTVFEA